VHRFKTLPLRAKCFARLRHRESFSSAIRINHFRCGK
jgi:hypothetical protein